MKILFSDVMREFFCPFVWLKNIFARKEKICKRCKMLLPVGGKTFMLHTNYYGGKPTDYPLCEECYEDIKEMIRDFNNDF